MLFSFTTHNNKGRGIITTLKKDIIDAIGRTPLVALKISNKSTSNVYAKLELLNPFGMKDRVAKNIILKAKNEGILPDGKPIIESSSGTMAAGIALVGTYLGHDVHIVTDPHMDPITWTKLSLLGCHIHVVTKMTKMGWQSARLEKLNELMKQYPGAFWPRQYENPNNPLAYDSLANELLEDLGHIDILVGAVGSGGSLSGTARVLKKHNPNLHVVAVDCVGSIIFGQPDNPGRLQRGLGNSLIPRNVNHDIIDEVHWLNDGEAFGATLELARDEKIFAGNTSGSVYAVARWLNKIAPHGSNIVAIFPDRGDRYIGTVYDEEYRNKNNIKLKNPIKPQEINQGAVANSWSFVSCKEEVTVCKKN